MSSLVEVSHLCEQFDIILLQETWLYKHDLQVVLDISKDHYGKAISSIDSDNTVIKGRPFGGLAILWSKRLASACKIIEYDSNRFLGIEIIDEGRSFLLINVYLPFESVDNAEDFTYSLSYLDTIFSEFDSPYGYACGDFNANIKQHSKFGKEIIDFCKANQYVIADNIILDSNTFTHFSEAHQSVSWLDHVITSSNGMAAITNCAVDYAYITSLSYFFYY